MATTPATVIARNVWSVSKSHAGWTIWRMITRVAKAWGCLMPLGRVIDAPMAVLILLKGTSMQIVVGPVLTREGGYAFDCWTPADGLSRGYTYGRIEDAHYARNVEIRSRNKGCSDHAIACSTVDDFARSTF
jgi:hypothetical protein